MGLTHKIVDEVDVRDLCEVAASSILLENDFFQEIHSRFYSRNLMNTLCHMVFQFYNDYKRLRAIPMVAKE